MKKTLTVLLILTAVLCSFSMPCRAAGGRRTDTEEVCVKRKWRENRPTNERNAQRRTARLCLDMGLHIKDGKCAADPWVDIFMRR